MPLFSGFPRLFHPSVLTLRNTSWQLSPASRTIIASFYSTWACRVLAFDKSPTPCRQQQLMPAMPFSDDLYSADVDYPDVDYPDVDSFSDELSPADGYFERAMPSGAMVPDPSQVSDDKTVEDKVLITRPEPRMGSGSSSRPTNSPTLEQLHPTHNNASAVSSPTVGSPVAPRSFNRIHPDALIMGAIAPPPAYSASPVPTSSHASSSPQSPQDHRSYNTFQQPHLEHRLEQGFLPTRDPQNMGRPEGEPNEEAPLVGIRVERKSRRRTVLRKLLFAALVLTVMTSVLTAALNWNNSVRRSDTLQK
jgi:hypothetical protein